MYALLYLCFVLWLLRYYRIYPTHTGITDTLLLAETIRFKPNLMFTQTAFYFERKQVCWQLVQFFLLSSYFTDVNIFISFLFLKWHLLNKSTGFTQDEWRVCVCVISEQRRVWSSGWWPWASTTSPSSSSTPRRRLCRVWPCSLCTLRPSSIGH